MIGEKYGIMQLAMDLRRLAADYPFVEVGTIGCSVLGQPLYALRIGSGPFRWHFNGSCHGNEWITTPLLVKFAYDYAFAACTRGTVGGMDAHNLLRRNTLWIVPMLNPDGVEWVLQGLASSDWKANARGVDLNDQFPAYWEEERQRRQVQLPGPRDYGGPAPLSEPEARALADWTVRMDFHAVLSLHTQGEEVYWNYRDYEPPCSQEWAGRLADAAGYRAVALTGSDAGYKDWFLQAFRRPGFTVEAGSGVNPLPAGDFPAISQRLNRLFAQALDLSPP